MTRLTRRKTLAGMTALGTVTLAGCVADDSDDNPDGDQDDDDDENGADGNEADSADEELELIDSELDTIGSDCGGPDSEQVDSAIDGQTLTISGQTTAPNPCHEAVLDAVTFEGGTLDLVVDVSDTTDADEACIDCVGAVSYEITCTFSETLAGPEDFESVTVTHEHSNTAHPVIENGESQQISGSEGDGGDDDDPSTVREHSIERTDADQRETTAVGDGAESIDLGVSPLTVEGWVVTPTPCYQPVIHDASVDDGVLSLDIIAREGSDEMCTKVISRIHYEATITVADGVTVDDVDVSYRVA